MGLGTTISKHLIEMMEGEIRVESRVGAGSVFHFTVKAEQVKDSTQPRSDVPVSKLEGATVLIADDNPAYRAVLQKIFASWKANVIEAETGGTVLEKLSTMNQDEPALAVLDIRIPETGAADLAREMRNTPERSQLPLIFLSSPVWRDLSASVKNLPDVAVLDKPISVSSLRTKVLSVLEKRKYSASGSSANKKLKILLAEDIIFNQKLAVTILEQKGHKAVVAENGKAAVEAFEKESFDLILMDIQMPEMDGLDATRIIREKEKETGGHIPIAAMTAHTLETDRENCRKAGMDAFIAKPIRQDEFLSVIEELTSSCVKSETKGNSHSDLGKVIDKAALFAIVDGNKELLKQLISLYFQNLPKVMSQIEEGIASGNSEMITFGAHALKGMSYNLSAVSVAQKSLELEKMGREGKLSGAEEKYAVLKKEIERLKTAAETLMEENALNA
jgi:CheY-like chemotaxis protein